MIVAATVPVEVIVTDFVTAVPTETLPNDNAVVFRLRAALAAFNWSEKLFDVPSALTETAALCEEVTEAIFAVNDVLDAPDAIVTPAGTVTAPLLLAVVTLMAVEGAAEVNDTVHVVVPAPVNALLLQENALIDGAN